MGRGSRLLVFVWSLVISIETPLLEEIPNKKREFCFPMGKCRKEMLVKNICKNIKKNIKKQNGRTYQKKMEKDSLDRRKVIEIREEIT